ncbi:MAG: hypothetical protein WD072_02865 [Pirellulales bacterium]
MRHSQLVSRTAADAAAPSLGDRLPASVKLYVDEVFDRTIVALHALLEPIGIDVAKAKFAPGFMAELAAVVQVAAWEDVGLRHLIPLDFPPASKAMSDLIWRYYVDPMSFVDSAAGTVVFNRVIEAWAAHCHPAAREMLGCDVVMAGPPCPADQAASLAPVIMAIAERINSTEHRDEQ